VQQRLVRLIASHRKRGVQIEQREHSRMPFMRPVTVLTRDGRELRFMSLDISKSGIRLLGNCSLLRQRVQISVASDDGQKCDFTVAILWAETIGDSLIQQGGIFLEEIQPSKN
jgi:hypothetical protein